jgi:hypothetical protein
MIAQGFVLGEEGIKFVPPPSELRAPSNIVSPSSRLSRGIASSNPYQRHRQPQGASFPLPSFSGVLLYVDWVILVDDGRLGLPMDTHRLTTFVRRDHFRELGNIGAGNSGKVRSRYRSGA